VKLSCSQHRLLLAALVALTIGLAGTSAPAAVSLTLKTLAARAASRRGWNALRRYARSTHSDEARGLAYLTLGYREYEAGMYEASADDLAKAVETECSLSSFAEYYEALADQHLNRDEQAIQMLTGFNLRHPESASLLRVMDLLASLLIQAGHPDRALAVLNANPKAGSRPSSLLLYARAYAAQQNDLAAVRAYQQLYYGFPTASEAASAQIALRDLRSRLGSRFPEVPDEIKTERAQKLFERGLDERALNEYDNLLLSEPQSPQQDWWRLARARCLIGLRRYSEAIQALNQPMPRNPDGDAQRLSLLVDAYGRADDEPSMLRTLDEIYHHYPHSPYYGNALALAGNYFVRQGFWQTAAPYYQRLLRDFPQNPFALEASWRVAWTNVLAGKIDDAQNALRDFINRYPNSPRTPAALYWLGWLKSRQGDSARADEFFQFLEQRFANSYYGFKARRWLRNNSQRAAAGTSAADITHPSSALADLGIVIPARAPVEISVCENDADTNGFLEPADTLAALSLYDLAEQYLKDAISSRPQDADAFLALARIYVADKDTAKALFAARRAVPRYSEYPFDSLTREFWTILYPRAYWNIVRRYARANRLDPYLVMGIIRQESAFNPRATSPTQARGLMQMEPGTATLRVPGRRRRRRIARALYSPGYNIRVSCRYLRNLLRSFNGNIPETLAAYNAGDFRVRKWLTNSKVQDPDQFIETIPFTDTRAYVEAVLRDSMIYRSLLTGEARFKKCARSDQEHAAIAPDRAGAGSHSNG
jgi:soluble lytic murein transglycosylase